MSSTRQERALALLAVKARGTRIPVVSTAPRETDDVDPAGCTCGSRRRQTFLHTTWCGVRQVDSRRL